MGRKREEIFINFPIEIDLDTLVNEVIESNSKLVLEYKSGIPSSLEKLVSEVMKKSYGRADPQKVRYMVVTKI